MYQSIASHTRNVASIIKEADLKGVLKKFIKSPVIQGVVDAIKSMPESEIERALKTKESIPSLTQTITKALSMPLTASDKEAGALSKAIAIAVLSLVGMLAPNVSALELKRNPLPTIEQISERDIMAPAVREMQDISLKGKTPIEIRQKVTDAYNTLRRDLHKSRDEAISIIKDQFNKDNPGASKLTLNETLQTLKA
jgi:hypothetical protein